MVVVESSVHVVVLRDEHDALDAVQNDTENIIDLGVKIRDLGFKSLYSRIESSIDGFVNFTILLAGNLDGLLESLIKLVLEILVKLSLEISDIEFLCNFCINSLKLGLDSTCTGVTLKCLLENVHIGAEDIYFLACVISGGLYSINLAYDLRDLKFRVILGGKRIKLALDNIKTASDLTNLRVELSDLHITFKGLFEIRLLNVVRKILLNGGNPSGQSRGVRLKTINKFVESINILLVVLLCLKRGDGLLKVGNQAVDLLDRLVRRTLESVELALQIVNTAVNLVDVLRVVRTAGVRECYASNGEHRNQSKKFVHKG